jgi:hypothetical protein
MLELDLHPSRGRRLDRVEWRGPVKDLDRMVYSVGDVRLEQNRWWVTSYAEQVTVGAAVRGSNRFDPDRVMLEWRQ